MKTFLKKILIYASIILVVYSFLGFLADGYTDPFYRRFTGGKETSMIIGTSRAAQGIVPEKFMKSLDNGIIDQPIYNYSFTVVHSPYGQLYDKMIKEKLSTSSKNGLFIVAVDPWSLSIKNNSDVLVEDKTNFGNLKDFDTYPNYDYLRNVYKKSMFSLLWQKVDQDTTMLLHSDGWLEVNLDMDPESNNRRTVEKLMSYEEQLLISEISMYRFEWLEKTINYLTDYGTVVLVRIPVSKEMLQIENQLSREFNNIIRSKFPETPYLDYTESHSEYIFIDGHHLYKESGMKFSERLAKDISNILKNE